TPTPGIPCATLPTVGGWYTTYDDSLSSAGVWNLPTPLDFKWVRITLKRNNMTPTAVNGDSTNSNQVCWDGIHQIVLPNGYGPECVRFGGVVEIHLNNHGMNYATQPAVTIDPPALGGVQATAHAELEPVPADFVQSVAVTVGGTGYTSAPDVEFVGDGT